jgi:hypothetical protein
VWVETVSGRARFTTKIVVMCAGVVSVEYGWWAPGEGTERDELDSIWISNANVLTNGDFDNCDPLLGQWTYNGLPCRVSLLRKDDTETLAKPLVAHATDGISGSHQQPAGNLKKITERSER